MNAKAWGSHAKNEPMVALDITRREPGENDVEIEIAYCGICHSDLHTARSEWPGTLYPCVPGHEIVGRVARLGAKVKGFAKGDLVGVGCIVDSCRTCASCKDDLEQYCEPGMVGTYNGKTPDAPGHTLGGYSQRIVVDQHFVLRVKHDAKQLAAVAPLLCAGITLYSPLKHWGAGPGKKVGIVGIGGLGHMGLKLSHALGARTVAFTTSTGKRDDAKKLGADEVVVTKNAAELEAHLGSFDLIINTVALSHDLDMFTRLLKRDGALVLVGVPEHAHPSPSVMPLVSKRRTIAGSMIGGIAETQEMLDFCAARGIVADIELVPAQKINDAYERMLSSNVKYRFVIDNATL